MKYKIFINLFALNFMATLLNSAIFDLKAASDLPMGLSCNSDLQTEYVIMSNKTTQVAELMALSDGRVTNWISDELPTVDGSPLEVLAHKMSHVQDLNILFEVSEIKVAGVPLTPFELTQKIRANQLDDLIGREMTWTLYLAKRTTHGIWISRGEVRGRVQTPSGIGGTGFDSLFVPQGATRSLAEEKPNQCNPRWIAFQNLINHVGEEISLPKPWQGSYRSQDFSQYQLSRLTPEELAWIERSSFKDLKNEDLLDSILEEARRYRSENGPDAPQLIVIHDLDETHLDNRVAVRSLFFEWLAQSGAPADVMQDLLQKTMTTFVGATHGQYTKKLHLQEPLATSWSDFFRRKFFSNEYTSRSSITFPGGLRYARLLEEAGVRNIYLTGRIGPSQRDGTLQTLRRLGYPLKDESDLICKWEKITTAEYKRKELERLKNMGRILAMFDNEPANLREAQEILGEGTKLVLMMTEFERLPKDPLQGLYQTNTWLSGEQRRRF